MYGILQCSPHNTGTGATAIWGATPMRPIIVDMSLTKADRYGRRIGWELLLSVEPNHRRCMVWSKHGTGLLIGMMLLTAFAAHPDEVVDSRTFVACSVSTAIDYFTDIPSHHLTCTQSLKPWSDDQVVISCKEGLWRVILSPYEAPYHTNNWITVKYRFDRRAVFENEWLWWRKGRFAYKEGTAVAVEFLDAITLSDRLVFQIGDERGLVAFGDADARAVDELKRRCAIAQASVTSAEATSGSSGAGAGAPGLTGQGYGSAGAGDFAWDDPGAGCEVLKNPDPETRGILGEGMTYHIKVRFRVDPSGLVTSAQITQGSGNSKLDTAVLSAARRMSFACNAEAYGVKSYQVG